MVRQLLVTTFGLGFLRPAPGTWGSLPPAAAVWVMLLMGVDGRTIDAVLIVTFVVFCAACIAFGAWAEKRFGKKDPSHVVADETAAQCMPLLFWPAAFRESCRVQELGLGMFSEPAFWRATVSVGASFLLFRVLDIIKPFPGRRLEKLPGGWGVLADDLSSGIYAAVVIEVAIRVIG